MVVALFSFILEPVVVEVGHRALDLIALALFHGFETRRVPHGELDYTSLVPYETCLGNLVQGIVPQLDYLDSERYPMIVFRYFMLLPLRAALQTSFQLQPCIMYYMCRTE